MMVMEWENLGRTRRDSNAVGELSPLGPFVHAGCDLRPLFEASPFGSTALSSVCPRPTSEYGTPTREPEAQSDVCT